MMSYVYDPWNNPPPITKKGKKIKKTKRVIRHQDVTFPGSMATNLVNMEMGKHIDFTGTLPLVTNEMPTDSKETVVRGSFEKTTPSVPDN
jgi:hypothetical protein